MPRELVLTDVRKVGFRKYEDPKIGPTDIKTTTLVSGINHGTEMKWYRGISPFQNMKWDQKLRLFSKSQLKPSPYPLQLGCENISKAAELGKDVTRLKTGDLIWTLSGHRETNVLSENEAVKHIVPKDVEPESAVFIAQAMIALTAVHDASIKLGDSIAIFGMGSIGQLAFRLAKLNGPSMIFVIDPHINRLKNAEQNGAAAIVWTEECDVAAKIKTNTDSNGVDVSIDLSGSYSGLNEAIRSCRMGGRVIATSFYSQEARGLFLGQEFHHNTISIICSQATWGFPHREYPVWNEERLAQSIFRFISSRRLAVNDLISHRINFEKGPVAYEILDKGVEDTVRIVLDYNISN